MGRCASIQGTSASPPPPGYQALTDAGVRGLVAGAPLPSKKLDHRRRLDWRDWRGARHQSPSPSTLPSGGSSLTRKKFRAIPVRRAIRP